MPRRSTLALLLAAGGLCAAPVAIGAGPDPAAAAKAEARPAGKAEAKPAGKAEGSGLTAEDPFASAAPAAPEKPKVAFEQLLKEATPVRDLATLIEPLYARCTEKDDLGRRQCEGMRAFLLSRLQQRTFVALSDAVPEVSPYDATAKEIDMEIPGCLTCAVAPVVSGEPRYLTVRPASRVADGKIVSAVLGSHQLPMATKVAADRFLERVVPRLRVEMIFRVGAPYGDEPGKVKGVTIVPVAHRVYDRCTGAVAAAAPAAHGAVRVKPGKGCPPKGEDELSQAELAAAAQQAALPLHLTSRDVETALSPVQERVHECYVEFNEVSGTAKVQLTLTGEGKFAQITLSPPFDKNDIGVCIKQQIKSAKFPRFRGEPMRIDYAFQVN